MNENQHVDVAILGSGFSGLGMAIRLRQQGHHDFVVLERAAEVGGTWHYNTYPGCACDVPSHLYSFSFAPNPEWSQTYSPQKEIWDYLRRCADEFGVRPHIRLGHEVSQAAWDEDEPTGRGRPKKIPTVADLAKLYLTDLAKVGSSCGIMLDIATQDPNDPSSVLKYEKTLSNIQEVTARSGRVIAIAIEGDQHIHQLVEHTIFIPAARWNHDYDLTGKRVASIGTGASAIQYVPEIQPKVAQLHVFQRTAPWVVPHSNRPITNFERRIYRALPAVQRLVRAGVYAAREALVLGFVKNPRLMRVVELVARRHMRKQTSDRDLLRKVTPNYTIGCKRILPSNAWYPALDQPNVELVTGGVREIRPRSIVSNDGVEREVDAIVFGTGFHVTDMPASRHLYGRDGQLLYDLWRHSPRAYLGTAAAGFPNLFLLLGPNTGLGHNSVLLMVEAQIEYVVKAD